MEKRAAFRKIKRKILAGVMAAAAVLSVMAPMKASAAKISDAWDGTATAVPETDSDGTFLISTGAELAWFAAYVNKGHSSVNAKLTESVYLNTSSTSYKWKSIGASEATPYKGRFNGNGKQILNLYAETGKNDADQRYIGLFGVIDGGSVENLTVSGRIVNGYADSDSSDSHETWSAAGGIAAWLKSGTIGGCVSNVTVTTENYCYYRNTGGIAGISEDLIINCENQGDILCGAVGAQYHVGGICGLLTGAAGEICCCANNGRVKGYFQVGGIAGAVLSGAVIHYSCNYGELQGKWYVGGICGHMGRTGGNSDGSRRECAILSVFNLGEVTEGIRYVAGIVGDMGYEDGTEESNPSLPMVQYAYSTAQPDCSGAEYAGAVVGHFKSGSVGNVYGLYAENSPLKVIGQTRDKDTNMIGGAGMLPEENLKEAYMIRRLGDADGSAFVVCSRYFEEQNHGYPMLRWQASASSFTLALTEDLLELNGLLNENNRLRYGKNYTQLEALAERYSELLIRAADMTELNGIMEEARQSLEAITPSQDEETELVEAIDTAIQKLQLYCAELIKSQAPDEAERAELEKLTAEYAVRINGAVNVSETRLILQQGQEALDDAILAFEENRNLEQIRQEATAELQNYLINENYEEPYAGRISTARNAGLRGIASAVTAAEAYAALNAAREAIDSIADAVPAGDNWDGASKKEPAQNGSGFYQITSADELAWFAERVNSGDSTACAVLCSDINLGGNRWTSIGTAERPFCGIFLGEGYTVRGLKVGGDSVVYAGLFGLVKGGAKISGLTVTGTVAVEGAVVSAGGIAGKTAGIAKQPVEIIDCESRVNITLSRIINRDTAAGGVVGSAEFTAIARCGNSGSVKVESIAVGGITYYCGGLVGLVSDGTELTESYNDGTVEAKYAAGGLVGALAGKTAEVISCVNHGAVTAMNYAGGLAAYVSNYSAIRGCYTSGPVNPTSSGIYIGALFGRPASGKMEELYALKRSELADRNLSGDASAFAADGEFVTARELRGEVILNRLNTVSASFIPDYAGYRNGYPLLNWELTLEEFRSSAAAGLRSLVSEDMYSGENYVLAANEMAAGLLAVEGGETASEISRAYEEAKEKIAAVETLAQAAERELNAKKDEAVETLRLYADLSRYRDEEKLTVTSLVSDGIKWINTAESQETVQKYLDDTTAKIDSVPTMEEYEAERDRELADEVDVKIMNIGEVALTEPVWTAISQARSAYNLLTDSQQSLVTRYQVLLDAESAYESLLSDADRTEEDRKIAAVCDEYIEAIGEVGEESGGVIAQARAAYDALTESQKLLVKKLGALQTAEEAYNALRARAVSAMIAGIGEVTLDKLDAINEAKSAYEQLSDEQKKLVTDRDLMEQASQKYVDLLAASLVEEMIDSIGEVTPEKRSLILQAINAYNDLTGEQQELVGNYDILEEATIAYDDISKIEEIENLINAIGTVSEDSAEAIGLARAAYDSLPEELQNRISNLKVLVSAENAYAALSKAQSSQKNAKTNSGSKIIRPTKTGSGSDSSRKLIPETEQYQNGIPEENTQLGNGTQQADASVLSEIEFFGESIGNEPGKEKENGEKTVSAAEQIDLQNKNTIRMLLIPLGILTAVCTALWIGAGRGAKLRRKTLRSYDLPLPAEDNS